MLPKKIDSFFTILHEVCKPALPGVKSSQGMPCLKWHQFEELLRTPFMLSCTIFQTWIFDISDQTQLHAQQQQKSVCVSIITKQTSCDRLSLAREKPTESFRKHPVQDHWSDLPPRELRCFILRNFQFKGNKKMSEEKVMLLKHQAQLDRMSKHSEIAGVLSCTIQGGPRTHRRQHLPNRQGSYPTCA